MGRYRMNKSSPGTPSIGNRIAEAWGCEGAWRGFGRASSWGGWSTGNRQGVVGVEAGEARVHHVGLGNLDLMSGEWGVMVGVTQERPKLRFSSARSASGISLSPSGMAGENTEAQKDPGILPLHHLWLDSLSGPGKNI